jgi:poly(A) polymerase
MALSTRWAIPAFPVTGADLLARGYHTGPALGAALRLLEDWWAASGFPPSKEAVLDRLAVLDPAGRS